MTYHDDPDHRGVFIELWVLDLLGGDYPTALLFSQLLWWHQPGKNGKLRVTHQRDGHHWLLRPDDGWGPDCRMTTKQVRRSRSVLLERGLIEYRRFKLDGAPTSAWRPNYEGIEAANFPIPELPPEGQFQGTSPAGAVPSAPGGEVPIPIGQLTTTSRQLTTASDFDRWYEVYPRHEGLGEARKAWPRALAKVGGDPERLIAGAIRYRDDPNREAQFTKHPGPWLNSERWNDDPLPARNGQAPRLAKVDQRAMESLERARLRELERG